MLPLLCVCWYAQMLSHVWLFVTPWVGEVTCQASLAKGFSQQKYWDGLLFPPPRNFPNPGVKCMSLAPPALLSGFSIRSATWEALDSPLIRCDAKYVFHQGWLIFKQISVIFSTVFFSLPQNICCHKIIFTHISHLPIEANTRWDNFMKIWYAPKCMCLFQKRSWAAFSS